MRYSALRLGMDVVHKGSGKKLGPVHKIGPVLIHGRYENGERWIAHCAEIEPDQEVASDG